ncbi:IS5/IS1182 family transposase, partial [Streptomyces sp. NPDC057686]
EPRSLTAARDHGIVQACLTLQIHILADHAYQAVQRDHPRRRAPGERASTPLKTWRILRRASCSTNPISHTVQAIHTHLTCDYSE